MIELLEWGYFGLFFASFLAATVIPFSSELVFSAMILGGNLDAWICVFVATAGNWLGGMTSYGLGRFGKIVWIEKYLKIDKTRVDNFIIKFQKYGSWSVFFSFLPFIGDVIAVAVGFLRGRWWIVAPLMLLGKLFRYIAWMYFHGLFFP